MGNHAAPRNVRTAGDHTDLVRTLFDTKAAGWQAKYAPDGRLAGRLSQLARAVGDRTEPGAEVLDLGCGSGELARQLAASGYLVTGCDIAPAMLYQAQAADARRAVRWIRLEPGWHALPFAARSVDTVVCASVLEYVRDPGKVFAECARVLRPGGILICTVPNAAHPVRWAEWPLRQAAMFSPAMALAVRTAGARHRAVQYLAYLRTSCQRRGAGWWHATARRSGLKSVPDGRTSRGPLRLLVFARPGDRPTSLEDR